MPPVPRLRGRNPLSSQVISNRVADIIIGGPDELVVIPYQVRSYQTASSPGGSCRYCPGRNPLSSQVISNRTFRATNLEEKLARRNPLSSQVISNQKGEKDKYEKAVSRRNPLSSQVISNPELLGSSLRLADQILS